MAVELKDFYLYQNCVVTQSNGDMGDAPQKTSMAHVGLQMDNRYTVADVSSLMEAKRLWTVSDGLWRRDPVQWTDPNDFSRDQQDPLIVILGLTGQTHDVLITAANQALRFGKYQNADWANPATFGVYIRALRAWPLWLLLPLCDLALLIGSIIMAFDRNPDSTDDDNHITKLSQAILVLPTPVSYLARKLYVWTRPANYGNDANAMTPLGLPAETSPIMGALAWKHRPTSGGNRAMVELWRTTIAKFFA